MGRVVDRLAAHVVIGQERRQMIGGRDAHAVEMGESAVPVPEQAHHGQHAVDGVEQGFRRVDLAAGIHLAQGQEIEQKLDEDARVAAGMAAIGQDLPVELAHEESGGAPEGLLQPLAAQARIAQGDRRHELLEGQRPGAGAPLQVLDQLSEDAQEALVEGVVRALQDQRRLADEGHEAAGDDLGFTRRPPVAEARGDELVHQRAGIGLGERRAGGPQVPQPAEAVERLGPGAARGHEAEGERPLVVMARPEKAKKPE